MLLSASKWKRECKRVTQSVLYRRPKSLRIYIFVYLLTKMKKKMFSTDQSGKRKKKYLNEWMNEFVCPAVSLDFMRYPNDLYTRWLENWFCFSVDICFTLERWQSTQHSTAQHTRNKKKITVSHGIFWMNAYKTW